MQDVFDPSKKCNAPEEILNHCYSAKPVVNGLLDEYRYLAETMFGKLKGDRDAFAKTSAVPVSTSTPQKNQAVWSTHIQKRQVIFYYVNYWTFVFVMFSQQLHFHISGQNVWTEQIEL